MDDLPLLSDPRCHVETLMQYAAVIMVNSALELVGTSIQRVLLTMVPASQGFVKLKSCNTNDMPLVDPNP